MTVYLWLFPEILLYLRFLFTDQLSNAAICACVELLDNIAVFSSISSNFPNTRGATNLSYLEICKLSVAPFVRL